VRQIRRGALIAAIAAACIAGGAIAPPAGRSATPDGTIRSPQAGFFVLPRDGASLDRSIEALRTRLQRVPGDAHAWAALGLAYLQEARITGQPSYYPRAEATLARARRLAPGDADAVLGTAILTASEHDFAGALALGRRARELDPADPAVHGIVGDALVELGRYEAGFASFQRMVDLRPNTASLSRVSYARELVGDVAGAIRAMRTAATYAATRADAAWTRSHLGLLLLIDGRARAARRAFRVAARLDPSATPPLVGRSLAAFALGDLRDARRLAGFALERTPAPEQAVFVGDLAAIAGDRHAASRAYDLARVGYRLLAANGVDVSLELALFEADHGDPLRALAAARAAWANRRSVQAADAMAWALHANGRDGAAVAFARRARALGTREGLFAFHAGMIQLGLDRPADGRSLLRRALAIDPWFSVLGSRDAIRILHGSTA
jgi:tetratricopeptide (TPR) repeat protein